MRARDLEVTRALLPCEFKSSGSAEVSHECRETSLRPESELLALSRHRRRVVECPLFHKTVVDVP